MARMTGSSKVCDWAVVIFPQMPVRSRCLKQKVKRRFSSRLRNFR